MTTGNQTEKEIMQNWNGSILNPVASISCCTYNHETYIAQAIDGFLMQKTTFPFEILIHDDASTDKTASIVKDYEKKYPNLIKPIYQTKNQFSKGQNASQINCMRAQGKYIAICEGDDYWTDPLKLQRQINLLEKNPSYIASTENGLILFTQTGKTIGFSDEPERLYTLDDLLIKRRFPTASVVYRASVNKFFFSSRVVVDTILWGILSQHGLIHYNPIVSSVYRRGCGITESDKIAWAYYSNKFNHQINKIFPISKHVKKIRKQDHYINLKNGWCEAYNKKKFRHIIQLLFLMLWWSPKLFFIDFTHFLGRRLLCSLKKSKH